MSSLAKDMAVLIENEKKSAKILSDLEKKIEKIEAHKRQTDDHQDSYDFLYKPKWMGSRTVEQ
tara:strand:+ start:433 stop:621 length:189 start_codon:yes stop_codon:yes gene_type:complete